MQGSVVVSAPPAPAGPSGPVVVPPQVEAQVAESRRAPTLAIVPPRLRVRFLRVLTPIILEYIGRTPNPWDLQHIDLGTFFERIWHEVFPDIDPPYSFQSSSPLYRLVGDAIAYSGDEH